MGIPLFLDGILCKCQGHAVKLHTGSWHPKIKGEFMMQAFKK
jgi:hypothetical protein